VSFSQFPVDEKVIGTRRKLKLHQKIARDYQLGLIKGEKYCQSDIEDSSDIFKLKKSLEEIISTTQAIQDKAHSIVVPLALGAQQPRRSLTISH
jgi:hypothetical protein